MKELNFLKFDGFAYWENVPSVHCNPNLKFHIIFQEYRSGTKGLRLLCRLTLFSITKFSRNIFINLLTPTFKFRVIYREDAI